MKDLLAKDQVRLGWLRCLVLTVAGIRYRMFRSLVTVAILALAVTFLAHGLSHSLIAHETRLLAAGRLSELRELGEWVARLRGADPPGRIRAHLADGRQPYVGQYRRWLGASGDELAAAGRTARRLRELGAYFESLPEAPRVILLAGRTPVEALRRMRDPAERRTFAARQREMAIGEPPGGLAALGELAATDLPDLDALTARIQAGHRAAAAGVLAGLGELTPVQWFATADETALGILRRAGFDLDAAGLARLRAAAENEAALVQLNEALAEPAFAAIVVRRLNIDRKKLTLEVLMGYLTSGERADWLAGVLGEHLRGAATPAPSGERLLEAVRRHRRQTELKEAVGLDVPRRRSGLFDLPAATRWLMILSFLVCAVGVTNAMFMSVTERFTEIATMKCLGALDGFLMQMFLFESAIQGLLGAAIGVVLGALLAVARSLVSFGGIVFAAMPVGDLLICAGLSLAAGVVLAVVAAIGPTWVVARLAPMEAMRIE